MFEDVAEKLKKGNQILFSRESECLQELIHLIQAQSHRTLVLWALECVQIPLEIVKERYPDEFRAHDAYEICQSWAKGVVKMQPAKRAILECHAVCKEIEDDYASALYHAIGQGLSTIHVETHALGLPIYECTAIVIQNRTMYEEKVTEKIQFYIDKLIECENKIDTLDIEWADFLLKDSPNKKKELWKRKNRGSK